MKNLKTIIVARIGRKLTGFAIWLLELQPFGMWDEQDKEMGRKLWELHDEFEAKLKGCR